MAMAGCRRDGVGECVRGGMKRRRTRWRCAWWDVEEEMDMLDVCVVG